MRGAFLKIGAYELIVPHRGRSRREEGLQRAEARGPRRPEPGGDQGAAEPHVEGLRQDPVLVAVVLLHAHPGGRRVPP